MKLSELTPKFLHCLYDHKPCYVEFDKICVETGATHQEVIDCNNNLMSRGYVDGGCGAIYITSSGIQYYEEKYLV